MLFSATANKKQGQKAKLKQETKQTIKTTTTTNRENEDAQKQKIRKENQQINRLIMER